MRRTILGVGLLVGMTAALVVPSAADVKPEDAIKYRKSVMTIQGWNIGPLGAMARGDIPFDQEAAERHARRLDATSHMVLEGFTPGSDVGETRARTEIWAQWEAFQQKVADLQASTAELVAAAEGGDADTVRQAVGNTGAACKACHDDYRSD